MTTENFKQGDKVIYIPYYTEGDINHKHADRGIVSYVNEKFVFVKYIRNDILQETAQATHPKDLTKENDKL